MKLTKLFLVCLTLICTIGCQNKSNPELLKALSLNGDLVSVEEIKYQMDESGELGSPLSYAFLTFDRNNVLINKIEQKENENQRFLHELEYDSHGNIVKQVKYSLRDTVLINTYNSTFNDDGYIVEKQQLNFDGNVIMKHKMKLDDKGNLIELITFGYNSSLIQYDIMVYNNSGKRIDQKIFNHDSVLVYNLDFAYNSAGNNTKTTAIDTLGEIVQSNIYTYNDKGLLIENIKTDILDTANHINNRVVYVYDKKDNWIAQEIFDTKTNKLKYKIIRNIVYR